MESLNELLHYVADHLALPAGEEREQLHDDVDRIVPPLPTEPPAVDDQVLDLTKGSE
jgi:hypothetical protein